MIPVVFALALLALAVYYTCSRRHPRVKRDIESGAIHPSSIALRSITQPSKPQHRWRSILGFRSHGGNGRRSSSHFSPCPSLQDIGGLLPPGTRCPSPPLPPLSPASTTFDFGVDTRNVYPRPPPSLKIQDHQFPSRLAFYEQDVYERRELQQQLGNTARRSPSPQLAPAPSLQELEAYMQDGIRRCGQPGYPIWKSQKFPRWPKVIYT